MDLGFPVNTTKHHFLLQDLKEFYPSAEDGDAVLGIAAQVVAREPFVAEANPKRERERKWLAKVPRANASPMPGMVSEAVILNRISLQAFAASFSPHWLDGSPGRLPLEELCVEMLRSENSAS